MHAIQYLLQGRLQVFQVAGGSHAGVVAGGARAGRRHGALLPGAAEHVDEQSDDEAETKTHAPHRQEEPAVLGDVQGHARRQAQRVRDFAAGQHLGTTPGSLGRPVPRVASRLAIDQVWCTFGTFIDVLFALRIHLPMRNEVCMIVFVCASMFLSYRKKKMLVGCERDERRGRRGWRRLPRQ